MAEAFTGLSVLATLKDPPGAKVRGLVIGVAEQQLTLNKVTWLSSGDPQDLLIVHGANIAEIEVEPETPKPTPRAEENSHKFVDPAILSYGRRDAQGGHQKPRSQVDGVRSSEPHGLGNSLSPLSTLPSQPAMPVTTQRKENTHGLGFGTGPEDMMPAATLSEPFNELSLNCNVHGDGLNTANFQTPRQQPAALLREKEVPTQTAGNTKKRARRSGSKGTASMQTQTTIAEQKPPPIPLSNQKRRNRPPKGWRQTPLLSEPTVTDQEPSHLQHATTTPTSVQRPAASSQPKTISTSVRGLRRRHRDEEDKNGWATGEATDIQDMGDFDFQENLSKFDKRKVFDQIRQDDTTADEARLVSFNRLPRVKPGTAGGNNLHYTNNVLESPVPKAAEHSSESELEISETRMSRTSTKRGPSRKGSALVVGDHHTSTATFVAESVEMARQSSNRSRAASPRIKSHSSATHTKSFASGPKPCLRLLSTNRSFPCISPLQMLELEQLAISELGLTEEMITENAARGIAETAYRFSTTKDEGQAGHWSTPFVVILAGNHKTGSRAIAAARHLRNHGARVVLCILGLEREDDLLDSVRRQLKIFCNSGGQAIKQDGLMRTLRKLEVPTDLIVDALLGMHMNFDDLRTDDQASFFQLVCWANDSAAATLSIDIPSGIDASSGELTSHGSQLLHIQAAHVLSLGAPKTGLFSARERVQAVGNLSLYVGDIGISPTAWKKFGTRRRQGMEFGGEWVVGVDYDTPKGKPEGSRTNDLTPRWL